MADFVITSVGLSASPITFTLNIKLAVDARRQRIGFRAQLFRKRGIALPLKQCRYKAHAAHVSRVHSRYLVKISADNLQQIFDLAVIRKSITGFVELLPIESVAHEIIQYGFAVEPLIEPGKIPSHAQIILGTAQNSHVVHSIPWTNGFSRYVIRRQVLVHVL